MRRLAIALVLLTATSACGGGGSKHALDSLTPAAAIRAAAQQSTTGSSKLDLQIETQTGGQDVKVTGSGAFGYQGGTPAGSMVLTFGQGQMQERLVGGALYLQLPGQPGFYKLNVRDLVGTQLESTSNPASSAQVLAAIGDSARKVGTEKVRGVTTTHYTGSIDIGTAAARVKGSLVEQSIKKLKESGVSAIPVEVYLDDQGRLRRMLENITLTVKGVTVDVATSLDFYDFGTAIHVEAPPADQVKDGSELLQAIKGQMGG